MNNKTLGIIIIVFGGLVLYSANKSIAWVVSAVAIGIGSGIFFWKDKKNDVDT